MCAYKALCIDLKIQGPIAKDWPNYSKLHKDKSKNIPNNCYHCHLTKSHPRYVAIWKVENNKVKIIEIIYVGSHEKTSYK